MPFYEKYVTKHNGDCYYFPTTDGAKIGYLLDPPRTEVEIEAIAVSNAIRSKPNWLAKSKNPEIIQRWKSEIKSGIKQQLQDNGRADDVAKFVLEELQFYQRLRNETGNLFEAGCDDRIFLSVCDDSNNNKTLIPQELKNEFTSKVKSLLEDIPEDKKDWHPGSNKQVLDLVHPSLYPLRYNVTPIKHSDSSLKPVSYTQTKSRHEDLPFYESAYQWLPSIFTIHDQPNGNGHKVTIDSYINNLHPVNCKALYQPIADIFALCLPGLEAVLSRCVTENYLRTQVGYNFYDPPHIMNTIYDSSLTDEENDIRWAERVNYLIKPKLEYSEPKETTKYNLATKFKHLKVITKLANIELTPENPKYPGGSWHIEGASTEDIIATVLYYYDIENITKSTLSFRTNFGAPIYEQNDNEGVRIIYGLEDGDPQVLNCGSVEAIEDRVVVFPNKFQHHVDPFELDDKTKPGHRKILCFFLCDPTNENVYATDVVPPQQRSWVSTDLAQAGVLNFFPPEIFNNVMEKVDGLMSFNEACQVRETLMQERSNTAQENEEDYAYEFSLCEH